MAAAASCPPLERRLRLGLGLLVCDTRPERRTFGPICGQLKAVTNLFVERATKGGRELAAKFPISLGLCVRLGGFSALLILLRALLLLVALAHQQPVNPALSTQKQRTSRASFLSP